MPLHGGSTPKLDLDFTKGTRGAEKFGVFPRDGMGKGSRLLTAGWEWDGKVGSHSVDGTGWEYTISCRDGTGQDHGTGRERSREIGREHSREIGGECGREHGREHTRDA